MGNAKLFRAKRRLRRLHPAPTCHYCERGCHWRQPGDERSKLPFLEATVDHKKPRVVGGKHGMGNLLIACRECNHDRGHTEYLHYYNFKRKIKKETKMKIHYNYLRAVLAAASKDVTRMYLTGVFVKFEPKKTTYVATDGHRLLMVEEVVENADVEHEVSFIIPPSVVKQVSHLLPAPRDRKKFPDELGYKVEVVYKEGKLTLNAATNDVDFSTMSAKTIDATYPDFMRVVPDTMKLQDVKDGDELAFNWQFLLDAQNAYAVASDRRLAFLKLRVENMMSPAKAVGNIDGGHTFTAVVMPMRI